MRRPKYKSLYLSELQFHRQAADRADYLERKMKKFRDALAVYGRRDLMEADYDQEGDRILLPHHQFVAAQAWMETESRFGSPEDTIGFTHLSYKQRPIVVEG